MYSNMSIFEFFLGKLKLEIYFNWQVRLVKNDNKYILTNICNYEHKHNTIQIMGHKRTVLSQIWELFNPPPQTWKKWQTVLTMFAEVFEFAKTNDKICGGKNTTKQRGYNFSHRISVKMTIRSFPPQRFLAAYFQAPSQH